MQVMFTEETNFFIREWRRMAKSCALTAMGWIDDAAWAWADEATILRRLGNAEDFLSKAQEYLSQADQLERQLGCLIHPEGV